MTANYKEFVSRNNARGITLSAPPGIKLSNAQWEHAVAAHLEKLGYGDECKFDIIKHGDGCAVLEHVHVIVSREVNVKG